MNVIAKN